MPRKQTGELTPTQLKHRNAKERDAKFRDFIQRQDVIDESSLLKKSKRIGHMKERFERETGYRMPLSMVYKNMNRVYPKKVTEDAPDGAADAEHPLQSTENNEEESIIEAPISGSDNSDGELQIV